MAIFTKRFADADEYEEWLEKASGRVNVLSISKSPTIFGASLQRPNGPVVLKYQTDDKLFAAPRISAGNTIQYVVVGAAFFALFAYVIAEL
jgi:hypothetical protein